MKYAGEDFQLLREKYEGDFKKIWTADDMMDRSGTVFFRGSSWSGLGSASIKKFFSFIERTSDGYTETSLWDFEYLQRLMPMELKNFGSRLAYEIKDTQRLQEQAGSFVEKIPDAFSVAKKILRPMLSFNKTISRYTDAYVAAARIIGAWESEFAPVLQNIANHSRQQHNQYRRDVETAAETARQLANARFRQAVVAAQARGNGGPA